VLRARLGHGRRGQGGRPRGAHRVMAFYVPDLPWLDDEAYWGWVVEPGDGRGKLAHDVRLTTGVADAAG
jgi:hypothetical protein